MQTDVQAVALSMPGRSLLSGIFWNCSCEQRDTGPSLVRELKHQKRYLSTMGQPRTVLRTASHWDRHHLPVGGEIQILFNVSHVPSWTWPSVLWKWMPASGVSRARASKCFQVFISYSLSLVPSSRILRGYSVSLDVSERPPRYSRHKVCTCPRRSIFNVVIAWHMLCGDGDLVLGIFRQ